MLSYIYILIFDCNLLYQMHVPMFVSVNARFVLALSSLFCVVCVGEVPLRFEWIEIPIAPIRSSAKVSLNNNRNCMPQIIKGGKIKRQRSCVIIYARNHTSPLPCNMEIHPATLR